MHVSKQLRMRACVGFNSTRAVPVQGVVGAAAKFRSLGNKKAANQTKALPQADPSLVVLAVDALQVQRREHERRHTGRSGGGKWQHLALRSHRQLC